MIAGATLPAWSPTERSPSSIFPVSTRGRTRASAWRGPRRSPARPVCYRASRDEDGRVSESILLLALLAAATARGAAPLVLAALGELFAERSGIVDIGLEGKMLASAFAAAATAAVTGSAWARPAARIAPAGLLGPRPGVALIT